MERFNPGTLIDYLQNTYLILEDKSDHFIVYNIHSKFTTEVIIIDENGATTAKVLSPSVTKLERLIYRVEDVI